MLGSSLLFNRNWFIDNCPQILHFQLLSRQGDFWYLDSHYWYLGCCCPDCSYFRQQNAYLQTCLHLHLKNSNQIQEVLFILATYLEPWLASHEMMSSCCFRSQFLVFLLHFESPKVHSDKGYLEFKSPPIIFARPLVQLSHLEEQKHYFQLYLKLWLTF